MRSGRSAGRTRPLPACGDAIALKPDLPRGAQQSRQRSARSRPTGGGGGELPGGAAPAAELSRGPQQPRRRVACPRSPGGGGGKLPRSAAPAARLSRGAQQSGNALRDLGRPAEAEASYREALRLRPDYPEAHNNLGARCGTSADLAEAEASCREALRLRPDFPEAHSNLGNALRDLGRPTEAEASYREALRLRPDSADAHNNLGAALQCLRPPAEAEASYREALRLRPDYPDAHNNLAHALLLAGRFEEGWSEYEWRWKTRHLSGGARDFPAPLWSGEAIGDRVILLHAEQGLGDTLQFCRYVPLIAAGARIVLEVQAPLVRLLSRLPGISEIVARGDSLPPFDLHCPLMSLPRAFGTTLDTIPAATPYLAADPPRAAHWRERLAGLPGLRVGLVWAGGRRPDVPNLIAADRRRSIALEPWRRLAKRRASASSRCKKASRRPRPPTRRAGMALHDFTADLRRLCRHRGAHRRPRSGDQRRYRGGASGRRARQAGLAAQPLRYRWRWLLNRDDSPWYPALRQFRQPSPGDWTSVLGAARDALQLLVAGDRDQLRPRHATKRSCNRP